MKWEFLIIIILILMCVIFWKFAPRILVNGGTPNVDTTAHMWAAVLDWDGKPELDPMTTLTADRSAPRALQPSDPAKFPNCTVFPQRDGSLVFEYFTTPCRLFRQWYKNSSEDTFLKNKITARNMLTGLLGRDHVLLNGEVKTVDIPYIAMSMVVEFEYDLLFQKDRLCLAAKRDGQPFIVALVAGMGLLSFKRYVELGFKVPPGTPVTIFAGELVSEANNVRPAPEQPRFYIFDVMVVNNKDLTNDPFHTRMERAPEIIWLVQPMWPAVTLVQQTFHYCGKTRQSWLDALDRALAMRTDGATDGLIISRAGATYRESMIMKFKTYREMTVDLLRKDGKFFSTFKDGCKEEPLPAGVMVADGVIIGPGPIITEINLHENKIVKLRPGKPNPNASKTVSQIRHLFENRTDIPDLRGDTIHLLKAYMRFYEKHMYYDIPDRSRILDLGAGVGRSHRFWNQHKYRVWATEPNPESYKALAEKHGIQHRNFGGENPEIQRWIPRGSIDATVMIHSLTFFNGDSLQALVGNLAHCIRPGGLAVGIGLDGIETEKMLKQQNDNIDNAAFRISRAGPTEVNITMKHAQTLVQDQREYLMIWPVFRGAMEAAGFTLQKTHFMPSNFLLGEWPRWFALSTRHWVFKR